MKTINCNGHLLDLSVPKVMGILNLTPDSFYDGGQIKSTDDALLKVAQMIQEGAAIIDIGGMSSRPGAMDISEQEEKDRVLEVIKECHRQYPYIPISIDTIHPRVAYAAMEAGASIINDIYGVRNEQMWEVARDTGAVYMMMHIQGEPQTMQDNPKYDDVVMEVLVQLRDSVYRLRKMGVNDIIVDPGFGFGKTLEHNYQIAKNLGVFKILDCPILVGVSRKSMIYRLLDITPNDSLAATSALHMVLLYNGANILRVHDVKQASQCIQMFLQLENSSSIG